MKRFLVLVENTSITRMANQPTYAVHECETIEEAVGWREREIGWCVPIIAEVIPPIEAYTMAKREAVLAEVAAATKRA